MNCGSSLTQSIFGCCMNIPIYVLCMIIGWSYYTVVFIICAGKHIQRGALIPNCLGRVPQYISNGMFLIQILVQNPRFLYYPTVLFVVPYHLVLFLFLWSFWRSVKTSIPPVPKQYCLSASETVRFIELDSEPARTEYLEQLVQQKRLPITLNNKRGTVPFCDICFLIKPDRTHHCSSCEKCVPKMDHHCPWINNCVGYHNQKYFLLFLFHAICYCSLSFLSTLGFFIKFVHNQIDFTVDGMHVFFLFIISLVFAIALLALLLFQMTLLFGNSSTLEHFRSPNFRDSAVRQTFSLGFKANFVQVFGSRPLYWLIPIYTRSVLTGRFVLLEKFHRLCSTTRSRFSHTEPILTLFFWHVPSFNVLVADFRKRF
ncbi:Palmitoyltransferase [Fasciolopsis buskii]|uniref:Palmitoyltransferase n=1 Tax=Fasciolopsis buskii TaxID=27845 RepID=A0A8E0S8T6_9TREM|nr:Palmitoyltransferase [Fasciolopsis buski]